MLGWDRPLGSKLKKGGQQQTAVVLHFLYAGAPVQPAHAGLHRFPVCNHIGDAGWDPQVVLQHSEAVVGPDEVGAADANPGAVGGRKAAHLRAVLWALHDHVHGDDAVFENTGFAVDVFQEEVERLHPLGQPLFQETPLASGDNPGYAVHGYYPFLALLIAVDGEGDVLVGEGTGDPFLDAPDLLGGEREQAFVERLVMLPGRSVLQEHLIIYGRF